MLEDEGEYQCQVITTPRKIPFSKNEYQIVRSAKERIKFFVLKEMGRSYHNYGSTYSVSFALWLERKSGIIGTIVPQRKSDKKLNYSSYLSRSCQLILTAISCHF
jgi:hypothetical protein